MLVVGIFYPRPGVVEAQNLPDGYVLSEPALQHVVHTLPGIPVLYNHLAVLEALQSGTNLRAAVAHSTVPENRPVGVVVDAWRGRDGACWCSFRLSQGNTGNVAHLIRCGVIRGLSLTHVGHGSMPAAIEVSLCTEPARLHCVVRTMVDDAFEYLTYKGMTKTGSIPSTCPKMPTAPDAMNVDKDSDSVLAAIEQLPENARKTVSEQLVAASSAAAASKAAAEAAEAEAARLKTEIEKIQADMSTDRTIMQKEVSTLVDLLKSVDPNDPRNATLDCATLWQRLDGPSGYGRERALDQMVTCASRAIMTLQSQINAEKGGQAKRAKVTLAVEPEAAETTPAVVEPTAPDASSLLRDALMATYER
jgi:hypothetical protein